MNRLQCVLALCLGLAPVGIGQVTPVEIKQPLALLQSVQHGMPVEAPPARLVDNWLNLRINSDQSGQVQNEQQIVVNPQNPLNVVAVWRDFRLGYRRVGVGYSFDGGWTWHDDLFPQMVYPWQSDPALTYNSAGAMYVCILSYDPVGEDGLYVSASTDGGVSWGPFYPAVNAAPNSFEDKELIACDRTGSPYDGNLYVAWAKFTSTTRIHCVRSTSQGTSWEAPTQVSDLTGVQWPVPAVGPSGEVYIAWVKTGSPYGIRFDKSLNGGVTWGTDVAVQSTSFGSAYITPSLLIFCYPAMDVDITNGPNRGYIYIAYSDDIYGDTDLLFTRSANGGDTWSRPIRINDDAVANGCDQFHPWLVCDEQGVLHVIFYDRRNDPVQNLYMDLYYSYSSDGGLSWSPNERITTVSSNPGLDSLDSGLIGEYNGLAVRDNVIHPIWTDTRNLNQDSYTAVWQNAGLQLHPQAGTPISGGLSASPRPFNSTLQVSFELLKPGRVTLSVYDLAGRLVDILAEGYFEPGAINRTWSPKVGSGVYFLAAESPQGPAYQRILYLK